ncbi:hypothetical protein ZIOFF_019859 [Zingiber officinale]|uniref:Uncharacterized protein n=1 Tax=Zingiber officinale TaxID=94328 RepID=A0A8J5HMT2_ZINOF|nr:hypothetical protein ZIOFF_019859 [Zingiber officinale]
MVVQKVQHREIYEVTEVDEVSEEIESENNFNIDTNQDNSSNEATLVVGEELEISQICRLDVVHQYINMSNAQVELARDAQSFLNDEDEDTEIDSNTDDQLSLSDDSAMPPKRIEHLSVLETPIDDSSFSGTRKLIGAKVLGTRSGYMRGLGSGPKPVRSTSSYATSSSRSTNAALRERLESTQDDQRTPKFS